MTPRLFPVHWARQCLLWAALCGAGAVALAQAPREAAPLAEDPVVEARLIEISQELRCLVCQNESLAGSRADLAQDLRREVRGLIKQGKTDAEIKTFLVDRYGDFVLYRPPVKPSTWLLWAGPFGLAVIGIVAYYAVVLLEARVLHYLPKANTLMQ